MRRIPAACAAALLLWQIGMARAAGFDAALSVSDGKATQSSKSNPTTAPATLLRRATAYCAADAMVVTSWKITRSAKDEVKEVLVHFYVVKIDRAGQAPPALDPPVVVMETALTMDFAHGGISSASQHFHVDGPGLYLVRIEAGGDPEKPGKEDIAEIELVVN